MGSKTTFPFSINVLINDEEIMVVDYNLLRVTLNFITVVIFLS